MTELLQNRKTFYDNLLDDGYFKDEDGSINFSFEEFDESLNDNDNIVTLYENLLGDGYFRDEDGEITLTGPDFVAMIGQSTEKQEYYPLTGNQLGIYADWEANRNTTQYNIPTLTRYEGIDVEHLVRALHTVVDAHPYLKMQLAETDEGVMQHRRDEAETVIQVHKMNVEPEKSFFQSQVRPFDLFSDDLYRIAIYQTPKAVYLFKDMHHIIYDGGSMGIFDAQLREAYSGGKIGSETYSAYEFSLEENARQQGEGYAEAEAFFDALLKGQSATPYPSSRTLDESRTQCQALGKKLDLAVSGYCRQHAITPNSFFMAALSLLLHKVSREDDVMYVTISHGRNTMEMMNIMGMFVKTLPVTSHMSPNDQLTTRFSDYARKAHEQYVDVAERDFYPFTTMVERHGVHPEILFAYQDGSYSESSDNGDGSTDVAGNIKSEHISLSLDTTKEPVTIEVEALGNDQYVLGLEYDTTRYNAKDMGRLLNAYAQVAIQVCEEDRTLGNIALVDKHEADVLHALGCGDFLVYDTNDTMVDILRHQAALTPDATAVVFRDRSLTYAQLDGLTDRLARYLTSSGVGRGQAVGVMIGRSELMLVYPMAIQKAGAAYMPLDPHFPEDRLMFMCDDAGVRLILSEGSLPPTVMPSFTGKVFLAEGLASLEEAGNGKWETGSGPKATDAAVILFTSGSTGKPKGCVLEHHGIVNFAHWYAKEMKMDNSSKSAGYANFGFDAHMIDIYPTLFAGGTVYILPEELRMDLVAMNDYIEANGITTAFFTTQIGVQMVSLFENKSLRTVSTGGEKMPPIRKPSYDFYNVYGPTECSMFSTFYKIETEYFDGTDSIIGRPLDNYQLYVVDSCMNLVPRGVPGELIVSGIGVGREYLNRPDITAEKFISFNGMKAYRTGDLVRWMDDGNIEFLGRIDNQIKLRGLRIELGEIENQVLAIEGINQAAAVVKKIGDLEHLVLYYTTTTEGISDEGISNALEASTLPHFMIPEVFVKLEVMPYNANGKIDRKALPMPAFKLTEYVAPRSETEKAICDAMQRILQIDRVGIDDDFFKLGGTSLAALKLQFQSGLKWLTVRAINEGKTARKIVQQVIEKERAMLPSHPSSESESKMLSIAQRIIGDNGISVVQDIVTISNNFSFVTDFVNACHEEGIEVSEQDVKTKRNIREMVTGTQSLAYWYRPYDDSKPVIVSVCGMVPQEYLGYRMNELSKTFNVLIFWPTFDFAEYGFSEDSLQDIVGLYHELVCCYLPEGVLPFGYIGYCLGGVIALMLASMMSKERKYYPLVYMLDSWPEVTFKESYEYDGVDEHGLDYDDLPEFLKNRLRFVRKISKGTTISTYDGYSVLFAATICEGHDIAQNKEFWKSKCSRLKIYDLPGTHDDIVCLDIHSDFVVKKVNKDFNKKGMSDKHDKS